VAYLAGEIKCECGFVDCYVLIVRSDIIYVLFAVVVYALFLIFAVYFRLVA